MTLDLKIQFFKQANALSFQKYLKKHGCKSRIDTTIEFGHLMEYRATLGAMETFINHVEEVDIDDPIWEYEGVEVAHAREWVETYKKHIQQIYDICEIGKPCDVRNEIFLKLCGINDDIDQEEFGGSVCTDHENFECAEYNLLSEITFTSPLICVALASLQKNGCLIHDVDEHSVTITEKKPIEEIIVSSFFDQVFGYFDKDDLEGAGFTILTHSKVQNAYTVIAGPEFIRICDMDICSYLVRAYGADEYETIEKALAYIHECHSFIDQMMDIIDMYPVSADELQEILSESDGQDHPFIFTFIPGSLDCILHDLEQIKVITIDDGIIRVVD